jgi:hypothetical protein
MTTYSLHSPITILSNIAMGWAYFFLYIIKTLPLGLLMIVLTQHRW